MPYDKVYSDGIRADPEASDMTTRSDGELDVVCPAQQLVVTMVISVIHLCDCHEILAFFQMHIHSHPLGLDDLFLV